MYMYIPKSHSIWTYWTSTGKICRNSPQHVLLIHLRRLSTFRLFNLVVSISYSSVSTWRRPRTWLLARRSLVLILILILCAVKRTEPHFRSRLKIRAGCSSIDAMINRLLQHDTRRNPMFLWPFQKLLIRALVVIIINYDCDDFPPWLTDSL